ncbi:MAG TPA: hypothetical protein VMM35_08020 [Longimicrobiales bacterium]|nr:hypothetical protein [Longimicrobiales bacterium]
MGGVCQYCEGGYWDCGKGTLCSGGANIDEDKLHRLVVLGKTTKDGCLQARLWVPGTPRPNGWKVWGEEELYVRVQTFWGVDKKGKKVPRTRVWLPKPDAHAPMLCPDSSEKDRSSKAAQRGKSVAKKKKKRAAPRKKAGKAKKKRTARL